MSAVDLEYRKQKAEQLLLDDVFAEALSEIGNEAMVALSDVEPTDTDTIRNLQSTVKVVRELPEKLREFIIAGMSDDN